MARAGGRRVRLGDRRHGAGEPGDGGSGHPERRRRHGDLHRHQRLLHGEQPPPVQHGAGAVAAGVVREHRPGPRHAAQRTGVHRGGFAARPLVRPRGHRLGGGHGGGRHRLRLPVHLPGGVLGDAPPAGAGGSGARRAPVGRVPDPPVRPRDARLHGSALVDRPGRLDRARRAVLLPARPGVRGDPRRRAGRIDPRGFAGPSVAGFAGQLAASIAW